jgi:hypothetical protein
VVCSYCSAWGGKRRLGRGFAGGFFHRTLQGSLPLLIQPLLFGGGEVLSRPGHKLMKPFGQGQCIKGVQVFHHGQQFFDALPQRVLIQAWQGYGLLKTVLHSGRLNDLEGHDFRGIIVPIGELGFAKGDCPDFLLIRLVFGKELDRGAPGLFDRDTAPLHNAPQ